MLIILNVDLQLFIVKYISVANILFFHKMEIIKWQKKK